MRSQIIMACAALVLLAPSTQAQCFSRNTCDPDALEVHSQLTVNVPVPDQASPGETMQVMEDARHQLNTLSVHECDTLKSAFGRECALTSVNINSNLQDRGSHKTAFVSVSNGYELKRPPH